MKPTNPMETEAQLALLLRRAEQGDRSVLPELRQALDADSDLWRHYGDLALQAEGALIRLAAGDNLLLAESLQRKLRDLKAELGGENPAPLERLLIQRVTATWLQIAYYDALAAQVGQGKEAAVKLIERQQDAAHRRHLAAVKTLAVVKKLLRPAPSPIEIVSRLGGSRGVARCPREGVAGTIPVTN